MPSTAVAEVGYVLRVGRGWADVKIEDKVRRVSIRQDLLVRAGCSLQIIDDRGVAILSTIKQRSKTQMH